MALYNIPDLKLATQELCDRLAAMGTQLRDGSLHLETVKIDFKDRFQRHALELTDALTAMVPPDTPGIAIQFSDGTKRLVTFSDRQTIACDLPDNDAFTAGFQLQTMARILRKLAASLPAESA